MKYSPKKILVADDDLAIIDSLKIMLELYDYSVCTTADGSVVKMMRSEKPDLLLLDIWMSGVDGRDLCREIKKDKIFKHIPIIMISASRDVSKSSKEAGADDFIAKPFELDDLLGKVGHFLQ